MQLPTPSESHDLSKLKPDEEVKFEEINFVTISDYGFEDSSTKTAKVYITKNMDGIKANCDQ